MGVNAAANLDWLYLLGGWLIGGCAALLLLWSLFRDRNRKLRRCPKCWYDMSGTPGLQCPECGRDARKEQRLHRTRRRWRYAMLATALGLVAYAIGSVPRYLRAGWASLVPSSVLVFIAPAQPETTPGGWAALPQSSLPSRTLAPASILTARETLTNQTWTRMRAGQLARWQSQQFVQRLLNSQGIDLFRNTHLPARWPVGEPISTFIEPEYVASLQVLVLGPGHKWTGTMRLPAQNAPTHEITVELGLGPPMRPVYRASRTLQVDIQGTRDNLLDRRDSEQDNQLVQRAVRPHIALNGDVPVLVLYDRDGGPDWDAVQFGVSYVYQVTLDDEVILSSNGWASWPLLSPTPGRRHAVKSREMIGLPTTTHDAVRSGRARIRVRGGYSAATEWYMASPFGKPTPACWAGEFSQVLEVLPISRQ